MPLQTTDNQAAKLRVARRATLDGIRTTTQAATRCGLIDTASTKLTLSRKTTYLETTTARLRALIASSAPACDAFESAWTEYRNARREEGKILLAISMYEAEDREDQRRIAQSKERARAELHELESLKQREEREYRSELTSESDGHFDPRYDEQELFLRKIRPWV